MAHDRRQLEHLVDVYLTALAANDPSRLPVTPGVTFSENYQPLKLGEGTWATITQIGSYKHYFADTATGWIGFIGTVRENGVGALLDLLLKVEGDKIAEIESFILRDSLCVSRYEEELRQPETVWLEVVPAEKRLTRAQMIASVDRYFQGMENNDGKGDYSFFDRECNRIEHALQTTNVKKPQAYGHSTDTDFSSMTAEDQWKTGFLGFVTEIRDRRFAILDEERQVAFCLVTLDHDGTIREIPMTTGKTFVIPPYFDVPRTLQVMEGFKLRGDKLYRVEMTLTELPYGTRPPSRLEAPAHSAANSNALAAADLVPRVLAAMKSHDPSRLPLVRGVRYTENGQVLAIGDGLWGTLTSFDISSGTHIECADKISGEASHTGAIVETSTKGLLTLRLKLDGAQISEIEAIVIRHETIGERGGTITLFQPRLLTEFDPSAFGAVDEAFLTSSPSSRADLTRVVDGYFDAIEHGSSKGAALSADCAKRDNGVVTAGDAKAPALDPAVPAYRPFALSVAQQIDTGFFKRAAKIRERHHIVDEARGVVVTIAVADTPARVKSFDVPGIGTVSYPGMARIEPGAPQDPKDLAFGMRRGVNLVVPQSELFVQLTKVGNGKITNIDVLTRGGPFGISRGWNE